LHPEEGGSIEEGEGEVEEEGAATVAEEVQGAPPVIVANPAAETLRRAASGSAAEAAGARGGRASPAGAPTAAMLAAELGTLAGVDASVSKTPPSPGSDAPQAPATAPAAESEGGGGVNGDSGGNLSGSASLANAGTPAGASGIDTPNTGVAAAAGAAATEQGGSQQFQVVQNLSAEDRHVLMVQGTILLNELVKKYAPPPFPSPEQQSRMMEHITRETIEPYMHLGLVQAAEKLGVRVTQFKRHCRSLGIMRWPYRQVRTLDSIIKLLDDCCACRPDLERIKLWAVEVRRVRKRAIWDDSRTFRDKIALYIKRIRHWEEKCVRVTTGPERFLIHKDIGAAPLQRLVEYEDDEAFEAYARRRGETNVSETGSDTEQAPATTGELPSHVIASRASKRIRQKPRKRFDEHNFVDTEELDLSDAKRMRQQA